MTTPDLEDLARKAIESRERLAGVYAGDWRDQEARRRDVAVQAFELAATPQAILTLTARNREMENALTWYGEQARLCRLIHSEGNSGRQALSNDGGKRAARALAATPRDGITRSEKEF